VFSLLTQKIDPPMPLLDIDGKPVDRKYSLGLKFHKGGNA
jgi:hypothetical protein